MGFTKNEWAIRRKLEDGLITAQAHMTEGNIDLALVRYQHVRKAVARQKDSTRRFLLPILAEATCKSAICLERKRDMKKATELFKISTQFYTLLVRECPGDANMFTRNACISLFRTSKLQGKSGLWEASLESAEDALNALDILQNWDTETVAKSVSTPGALTVVDDESYDDEEEHDRKLEVRILDQIQIAEGKLGRPRRRVVRDGDSVVDANREAYPTSRADEIANTIAESILYIGDVASDYSDAFFATAHKALVGNTKS